MPWLSLPIYPQLPENTHLRCTHVSYTYVRTYIHTLTHIRTYMHAYTYIHTHTHTCIHTCIHTDHTYIKMRIAMCLLTNYKDTKACANLMRAWLVTSMRKQHACLHSHLHGPTTHNRLQFRHSTLVEERSWLSKAALLHYSGAHRRVHDATCPTHESWYTYTHINIHTYTHTHTRTCWNVWRCTYPKCMHLSVLLDCIMKYVT